MEEDDTALGCGPEDLGWATTSRKPESSAASELRRVVSTAYSSHDSHPVSSLYAWRHGSHKLIPKIVGIARPIRLRPNKGGSYPQLDTC